MFTDVYWGLAAGNTLKEQTLEFEDTHDCQKGENFKHLKRFQWRRGLFPVWLWSLDFSICLEKITSIAANWTKSPQIICFCDWENLSMPKIRFQRPRYFAAVLTMHNGGGGGTSMGWHVRGGGTSVHGRWHVSGGVAYPWGFDFGPFGRGGICGGNHRFHCWWNHWSSNTLFQRQRSEIGRLFWKVIHGLK